MTPSNAMKNHSLLSLLKVFAAAFVLVFSTAAATAASDIAVTVGATAVADGGTHAFGNVPVSGPNGTVTFTITNGGVDPLDLTSITLGGTHASEFSISPAAVLTNVAAGGTRDFTVICNTTSSGAKDATVTIVSDAPGTKSSYVINLTANGTAPEIAVENMPGNTNITTGDTRAFGSVALASTISKSFRIKSTGDGNLTSAITITGPDAAFFTVAATPVPATTIAAGSNTDFTVQFAPTTEARAYVAAISIANNDPDDAENPFIVNLTGTGTAPDIGVEAPLGTPASNTLAASFGTVTVNGTGNLTFTITNTGNATLTLGTVTSTGTGYSVKSQPTSLSLAPAATTTFTMQFKPLVIGASAGTVSIPTNLPNVGNYAGKSPYVINLTGIGGTAPSYTDQFGYVMAQAPPAAATSFLVATDEDVFSSTGFTSDDDFRGVDLGFNFSFYDKIYSRCYVSTNGLICFDKGDATYTPAGIPTVANPNTFIAPFWTDLDMRAGGAIRYSTRGTAPNRVFIVKYENAPEFGNTNNTVTFQVLLYENTNAIEVQYRSITGTFNHSVGIGIESRDYGTTQPQPAGGVVGLQYAFGAISGLTTAFNNAPFVAPSAVRFIRPVIVTVESKYAKPTPIIGVPGSPGPPVIPAIVADPNATTATDTPLTSASDLSINPPVGTIYWTVTGAVRRFDAPEVIYLDRNFNKLAAVGEVNDTNPAWYRLVNDGYAIDGQVVQGTHAFLPPRSLVM